MYGKVKILYFFSRSPYSFFLVKKRLAYNE